MNAREASQLREYAEFVLRAITKVDGRFGVEYLRDPDQTLGLMEQYELAKALLSLLPAEDDGTVVTENWLAAVMPGAPFYHSKGWIVSLKELPPRLGMSTLVIYSTDTRDGVRRLCEALSIPLSEPETKR